MLNRRDDAHRRVFRVGNTTHTVASSRIPYLCKLNNQIDWIKCVLKIHTNRTEFLVSPDLLTQMFQYLASLRRVLQTTGPQVPSLDQSKGEDTPQARTLSCLGKPAWQHQLGWRKASGTCSCGAAGLLVGLSSGHHTLHACLLSE
jgi:hypothetical protein